MMDSLPYLFPIIVIANVVIGIIALYLGKSSGWWNVGLSAMAALVMLIWQILEHRAEVLK